MGNEVTEAIDELKRLHTLTSEINEVCIKSDRELIDMLCDAVHDLLMLRYNFLLGQFEQLSWWDIKGKCCLQNKMNEASTMSYLIMDTFTKLNFDIEAERANHTDIA